jgi:hypothetical protein
MAVAEKLHYPSAPIIDAGSLIAPFLPFSGSVLFGCSDRWGTIIVARKN